MLLTGLHLGDGNHLSMEFEFHRVSWRGNGNERIQSIMKLIVSILSKPQIVPLETTTGWF